MRKVKKQMAKQSSFERKQELVKIGMRCISDI